MKRYGIAGCQMTKKIERIPFECRVCGAGPSHTTVGTWGGLFPIEFTAVSYDGGMIVHPLSGIMLCEEHYADIRDELLEVTYKDF